MNEGLSVNNFFAWQGGAFPGEALTTSRMELNVERQNIAEKKVLSLLITNQVFARGFRSPYIGAIHILASYVTSIFLHPNQSHQCGKLLHRPSSFVIDLFALRSKTC